MVVTSSKSQVPEERPSVGVVSMMKSPLRVAVPTPEMLLLELEEARMTALSWPLSASASVDGGVAGVNVGILITLGGGEGAAIDGDFRHVDRGSGCRRRRRCR